jgi:hypothetical protein
MVMIALNKIVLLALILFLPSYSQEPPIGEMVSKPVGRLICGNNPAYYLFTRPYTNGDTIKLEHDQSYALFSGTFQEIKNASYVYREFRVKSVIRGSIDTTTNNRSIIKVYELKICSDIKFDVGKDYLVLDAIKYDVSSIAPYIPELEKCEGIFPDTPENRQKLIEKYDEKVVIRKPKPSDGQGD